MNLQNGHHPSAETLAILATLVSFNTVSRESNLGLIEWARDYLNRLGATTRLTYDRSEKKANLFASYGDPAQPGTVFSGHTDVVPVDGQQWDSDPFSTLIADGKVYGRGTCDMKGFIAVCLARLPAFAATNLHTPLHFSFSYDEEVGCLGVRELLADLQAQHIKPTGCIIGEPTMMRPAIAHKGKRAYRCSVHGHAAHSSLPHLGINSIDFAAELIVKIREIAHRLRTSGMQDSDFDVPFSSVVTTLIQGGNSSNTIPGACEFVFEHRFLPGDDPARVLDELRSYAKDVLLPQMKLDDAIGTIGFEMLLAYPGLNGSASDAVARRAMEILGAERAGKVGFGTEGGLFSEAGIPAVICGPGDIAQAHKPNEFVTLDQLAKCEAFFDDFVRKTCY